MVSAVARINAYKAVKRFTATGKGGPKELMHRPIGKGADFQHYEVFVPNQVLNGRTRFEAVMAKNFKAKIWTAGQMEMPTPSGWRFSKFHLNLTYDPKPEPISVVNKVYIKDLTHFGADLILNLGIFSNAPAQLEGATFEVRKFRDEGRFTSHPIVVQPAKKLFGIPAELHVKLTGLHAFNARVVIPASSGFLDAGLYSFLVTLGGGFNNEIYYYSRDTSTSATVNLADSDRNFIVHHFPFGRSRTLKAEFFPFDRDNWAEARDMLAAPPPTSDKNLWVIGEYSNTARDNGWNLFEYIRKNRTDIDVKYVISVPNFDDVEPDGKSILRFGSIEHLRACRAAGATLFTHHSLYVVPRLIGSIKEKAKGPFVEYFLQHGVLGLKPMLQSYQRRSVPYDLFNVSSKWEQDLVISECGWKAEDVTVCGLPRWDTLKTGANAFKAGGGTPESLLVFPTWRAGLEKLSADEFAISAFAIHWRQALLSLVANAKMAGLTVDFCAHSIIQRFNSHFDLPGVRTVSVKDAVARLPAYELLVTDYSSLTFDFLYLKKPTVFFMFDKDDYFSKSPPYINPDEELPGFAAQSAEHLGQIIGNRSKLMEQWASLCVNRDQFIGVDDEKDSSARIVAALEARLVLNK